ncbi:actin-like ATPase domain-containing protein [Coemansia reversa NRRL 1564]|uniref:Phosphotransferase n=1 Tax=Coemansia reversa (strain ATCC 12441 / NRRL 1564) TaxID=763665 RepID=A0A2G5B7V4_COERN|nr:actin-like ATPase domain-containing protein [Coemansia reversa NRRL 1564]|eukprot:PIA15074.1 actin-like ATPase domain-containing protein [Coemansia reversa NRRL 1564]
MALNYKHTNYVSALSSKQQALLDKIAVSFDVSDKQLDYIVSKMQSELFRGLSRNRTSELYMSPSFVHHNIKPQGDTVSLGMSIEATGRRIRIASIYFDSDGAAAHTETQVFVTPLAVAKSANKFFDFVAYCIRDFVQSHALEEYAQTVGYYLPLGITIGLPVDNKKSNGSFMHCNVSELAKEDSLDLCGKNVGWRLCDSALRSYMPVRVTSVTNNVVSALVAARFHDKGSRVAAAFNHGINAAYFEKLNLVEKLSNNSDSTGEEEIAINTEIGRFGSVRDSLPRTMWDRRLDRESRCPNTRALEKLVADQYLGEIARNLITDFVDNLLIFSTRTNVHELNTPYVFHTAYMAPIIEDCSENLTTIETIFTAEFDIETSLADRQIIRAICQIIAARAARISGAVLAALVLKASDPSSSNNVSVALSGALFDVNNDIYEHTVASMKKLLAKKSAAHASVYFQDHGDELVGAAVNAACL